MHTFPGHPPPSKFDLDVFLTLFSIDSITGAYRGNPQRSILRRTVSKLPLPVKVLIRRGLVSRVDGLS